jgi:hypothetical protein
MRVSATSGLSKDELDKLANAAKGRVISSLSKEEKETKGGQDAAKKQPAPAVQQPSFTPKQPAPQGGENFEILTGDMLNSFLKDPDEPFKK